MNLPRKRYLMKTFKLLLLILSIVIMLVIFTTRRGNTTHKVKSEAVRTFFMSFPNRKVDTFNCANIFNHDFQMSPKLREQAKESPYPVLDLLKLSANCSQLITERGYIMDSMTIEEEMFPIAYGIFFHNELNQIERLLRAIYRPQNIYVIHLDRKANLHQYIVIKSIAKCFPNVFLSSKRIAVVWGTYSLVEADMVVMKDLLRFTSWRYYINLCGMDFPLKTNLQIVRILRGLNEENAVSIDFRDWSFRWKKALQQKPIPHNIKPAKGSHYVAVTWDFVNFTVNNQIAKDYIQWLKNTLIPDESLYATIFYNAHIGTPHPYNSSFPHLYKIVKYVVWITKDTTLCLGTFRHSVCVYGLEDLKRITLKDYLFANKFQNDLTFACMEEWYFNKTRDEYLEHVDQHTTLDLRAREIFFTENTAI